MFAPNFPKAELIASNTATARGINNEPNQKEELNLVRLSWFLQSLRDKLNQRFQNRAIIRVSSGFRNAELNRAVGGSRTSDHLSGLAADITTNVMTPFELTNFIAQHMVEEGWNQVILEFGRWVHVGLHDGPEPKLEILTAYKDANNITRYRPGIHNA